MRQGLVFGVVVGLCVVASHPPVVTAQSAEPWLGTWRLNVEKSKSTNKGQTVRMESVPNGVRTVIDTIDAKGGATHQELVAMFDGKEYEVKGAAAPTTRAYKRTDRDYEYATRVNGKVTTTSRGAVSADGKTRTLTTTGTDAQGQSVNTVAFYEKQ